MIKRILTISPEFNEEFILYQPWRQICELGKVMTSKGIEFAIGTNSTDKNEINGLKIIKLEQEKIQVLSEDSKKKISKFNPDVIYWIGNSLSGIYIKQNQIDDVPIILYISTIHILWEEITNLTLKEILQLNLHNLLTAFFPFNRLVRTLNHTRIDGIIVPNNIIKNRLIKLGVKESKIMIAPLCFETDYDTTQLHKYSINKQFTICYFGPSYSIRGIDILIDVMVMFKKMNYPIHLDLLLRTTNPEKEKLILQEKCRKKGILDLVTITAGILDRKSLFQIILNSNVVVLPTKFVWNEPPLAILETMMLGKPIVTTNVCGLPELISDNGFTIKPDKNSFYHCVKNLAENSRLQEDIGNKSKKFVQSLSGWEALTNWTIDTLDLFYKNHTEKNPQHM